MDESTAVAAMADALVASGAMTQGQIDAGMAAEQAGIALETNAAAPAEAAIEPVVAKPQPSPFDDCEIDPVFAPPESAEGYQFQMQVNSDIEIADIKAAQQLFHSAKVPQPIAQALFSEVERMHLANGGQEMPNAQLEMMNAQTMVQLRQAWVVRTDEMLGHGRRLVSEIAKTNPRILEFLDVTGAGSNPVVVRQIAEHAQRIYSSRRK